MSLKPVKPKQRAERGYNAQTTKKLGDKSAYVGL